jgi:hypothetical protein
MIKNTSTKLKIRLTCDYPEGYPKTTPQYLYLAPSRESGRLKGRRLGERYLEGRNLGCSSPPRPGKIYDLYVRRFD